MTDRKRNPDPSSLDIAAEIAAAAAGSQEAPDMSGGDADAVYEGPGEAGEVKKLPHDCPVTPLGQFKQKFLFLDYMGQLIELGSEFRKGELMALYGTRMRWLEGFFPQWKRAPNNAVDDDGRPIFIRDGFSQKDAQQGHILSCAERGLFDRRNKERGRGAHLGDDGEIVLHCGDAVIVGGRKGVKDRAKPPVSFKSGFVGGYVYPTLPALARPHAQPASTAIAGTILECLKTWNWKRKEIAAHLLFCWIATASLGGALRIRPHGWIVGPSGAGKTTLQQFLREMMGDWGVTTEDATEAGVRQLLDQDTLPVMFDEIEAEEDNRDTVMRIVRLARLAYSGASSLRGSSDHQAKQFVARSCFLFSSIHHHELPAQDRNRIAILQLSAFEKDASGNAPPPFLVPPQAKEWGDQLRRRLIEQWPRFEATLLTYQREMMRQGYTGREQDTYGTLLACGDLLLHDEMPDPLSLGEHADRSVKLVKALAAIVESSRAEAVDTAERCLKSLASFRLAAKGSEPQETVARWLQKLIIQIHNSEPEARDRIKQRLTAHGLKLVHLKADHLDGNGQGGLVDAFIAVGEGGKRQPMWLAVANKTNRGTQEIFAGSMWQGGVWTQSLTLVEGSFNNKKARFGGGTAEGCVLVPIDSLVDVDAAIEEAEGLRGRP